MRYFYVTGIWLVISTILFAGPLQAEPEYRERIEYYDIGDGINSRASLLNAIHARGPGRDLEHRNRYVLGLAIPRFEYTYKLQEQGGHCRFRTLEVDVKVVIRLPGWAGKDFAPPELQRYYQCIFNTVAAHEKHHAQIAYEAGEEIEARFYSELGGSECQGFDVRAKHIVQDVVAEHNRRQIDFDRRDYARKRLDLCATGSAGPAVDIASPPQPTRFAALPDLERADNETGPAAERRALFSENTAAPLQSHNGTEEFSLETTKSLLAAAGYFIAAIFLFGALFAGVMLAASRYERHYRQYEIEAVGDDFAQPGMTAMDEPKTEFRPRLQTRHQSGSKRGPRASTFGKRTHG